MVYLQTDLEYVTEVSPPQLGRRNRSHNDSSHSNHNFFMASNSPKTKMQQYIFFKAT